MENGTGEIAEEGDSMLHSEKPSNPNHHSTPVKSQSQRKTELYMKLFFIQWAFLFASSIFAYFFVGELIQDMVNKKLVISPDSDFFNLWEKPPLEPEMRVYLFNITNSDRWLQRLDSKLIVNEIGPFTYRETWIKSNVTFNRSDGTVSYRMLKKFTYVPDKSMSDNSIVVFPNIPLFSAAASMKGANSFMLLGFNAFINNLMDEDSKKVFLVKSVKDFVWGYDDQLTNMAKFMLPPEDIGVPGKFGLLSGKNNSYGPWQTVKTGENNLRQISQTVEYNGQKTLKAWGSSECNTIKGSDGSFFSPRLEVRDTISIFVPDLCTNINLQTDGHEVSFFSNQIKALRFKPHRSTFNYDLETNKCFCKASPDSAPTIQKNEIQFDFDDWDKDVSYDDVNDKELICPPTGTLDLGPCKFGAPLFVSWPHFYGADESLRKAVDGLKEAKEIDHGFYMDIQPTMGIGLSAAVRLQMNLKMENSPILPQLPRFDPFLLPVMWFEDTIVSPPDDLMTMLRDALKQGSNFGFSILVSFMALLALELVILVAYLVWRQTFSKSKSDQPSNLWWKDISDAFQIFQTSS